MSMKPFNNNVSNSVELPQNKANIKELLLFNNRSIATVCLQETFLKQNGKQNTKEYHQYNYTHDTRLQASSGTSILIKNGGSQSKMNLTTTLKSTDVKSGLTKANKHMLSTPHTE